jgi:predicted transcriptional regulator
MTDKQRVLETISGLPEQASLQQIAEEVEILAALRRGEAAADAGRTTPHEEVKNLLASWLPSFPSCTWERTC